MIQKWNIRILMTTAILVPFLFINIVFYQSIYCPVYLEDTSSNSEFKNQLDEKIDGLLNTFHVPGIAIGIISNESVDYIIRGKSDYWKGVQLSENSLFQIASMSKTHCAFAIMKLVQEGLVHLDVPIETYLTRWTLPESGFDNSGVTIRRILCHASGLSLSGVPVQLSMNNLPSIEEALSSANVRVIFEPGSVYSYSGGGFAILQLIIEEVTGMTYDEYLRAEIFQPLNLTDTYTDWNESLDGQIANGYGSLFLPIIKNYIPMKAAAGHYSSVSDMVKWCNLFLKGQILLNQTIIDAMLTPQWGENWGYTLGFNYQVLNNGSLTIGHGGDNWGYHGLYRFILGTGDGIVILSNGDRGAALRTEILQKWEKLMGGSSLETDWIDEKRDSMLFGLYWLVGSIILVLILFILNKLKIISFNQKEIREKFTKRKRLWVNIIRTILSVILIFGTAVFILRWGWLNGFFSSRPPIYIWNLTMPVMWLFWFTVAIHYLTFNYNKIVQISKKHQDF